MFEKGDLLTLDNNKEYLVVNQLNYENNNYVFLIAKDGISDIMICLFKGDELIKVEDSELIKKLIERFESD